MKFGLQQLETSPYRTVQNTFRRVRQMDTVASPARGHWGKCPPWTSNNFTFSSLQRNSESQLSKYCV